MSLLILTLLPASASGKINLNKCLKITKFNYFLIYQFLTVMSFTMRRNDKKITREDVMREILDRAEICRLALAADNMPYVVPLNFAYHNHCIYIHSAAEGKKIEYLKKNNLVCFEIEDKSTIIPGEKACDWSIKYRSVIGYGHIHVIENRKEKIEGMNIIMNKFAKTDTHEYDESLLDNMVILRIDITDISGKQSGKWD